MKENFTVLTKVKLPEVGTKYDDFFPVCSTFKRDFKKKTKS